MGNKKVLIVGNVPGIYLTDRQVEQLALEATRVIMPVFNDLYVQGDTFDLTRKQKSQIVEPVRSTPKIGRNEKCPCGSEKKYKNCCLNP